MWAAEALYSGLVLPLVAESEITNCASKKKYHFISDEGKLLKLGNIWKAKLSTPKACITFCYSDQKHHLSIWHTENMDVDLTHAQFRSTASNYC